MIKFWIQYLIFVALAAAQNSSCPLKIAEIKNYDIAFGDSVSDFGQVTSLDQARSIARAQLVIPGDVAVYNMNTNRFVLKLRKDSGGGRQINYPKNWMMFIATEDPDNCSTISVNDSANITVSDFTKVTILSSSQVTINILMASSGGYIFALQAFTVGSISLLALLV